MLFFIMSRFAYNLINSLINLKPYSACIGNTLACSDLSLNVPGRASQCPESVGFINGGVLDLLRS